MCPHNFFFGWGVALLSPSCMRAALLLALAQCTTGFFLSRGSTLALPSGATVRMKGNGPPVVFAGGLFNAMPARGYSSLLASLQKNVTILTLDKPNPTAQTLREVARAIGVDQLGLVVHSALNPDVLASCSVKRAVLLDPCSVPSVDSGGLSTQTARALYPTLVLEAGLSRQGRIPFIPDQFAIEIEGDVTREVYPGVGHSDLLDDSFAGLASRVGIEGVADSGATETRFEDWSPSAAPTGKTVRAQRSRYRAWVAEEIVRFFT